MFETLFSYVDTIVLQNVSNMSIKFIEVITPLIGACVLLYAIYLAYQALYDSENMVVMESLKFIGSLALCATIALSSDYYISNIVPIIYHSGDLIASKVISSVGAGSGATIQTMFDTMIKQCLAILDKAEFGWNDDWGTAIIACLTSFTILIGYVCFLTIATAYLLVTKVMTGMLLIIGPLFIMFSFFPSTRSMFTSWTGTALNYTLLTVLFPIAFSIFKLTIDKIVNVNNSIGFDTAIMTFIVLFTCLLISVQIPAFCSSLSGGASPSGVIGNTAGAAGLAYKAGSAPFKAGMKGYNSRKNNKAQKNAQKRDDAKHQQLIGAINNIKPG